MNESLTNVLSMSFNFHITKLIRIIICCKPGACQGKGIIGEYVKVPERNYYLEF